MTKVELFEVIRKEHYLHGKSIKQIARERRIHRRMVRQALSSATPPARKISSKCANKLTPAIKYIIDSWLLTDHHAPKKQRHTSHRIYSRLKEEYDYTDAESSIRKYVGKRRRELGLRIKAMVPQQAAIGECAEVDWYEAIVFLSGKKRKVYIFQMRACYSGKEFHIAFPRATQQTF